MDLIELQKRLRGRVGAAARERFDGELEPVPAEVPPAIPASDRPTDKPGSDFLREAWLRLVFFLALVVGGVWLWFYKRSQERTPKEA